jgi:hypothetical protein
MLLLLSYELRKFHNTRNLHVMWICNNFPVSLLIFHRFIHGMFV